MAKWWEKEPIRFECQPDCFKCCSKPGVVYMDPKDIRQAAKYLNLTVSKFKSEFLTCQEGLWSIEVEENHPCPFLVDEGCAIHKVKPTQCRNYPFWKENLESKNHWKRTTLFCPGIGLGRELSASFVRNALKLFKR